VVDKNEQFAVWQFDGVFDSRVQWDGLQKAYVISLDALAQDVQCIVWQIAARALMMYCFKIMIGIRSSMMNTRKFYIYRVSYSRWFVCLIFLHGILFMKKSLSWWERAQALSTASNGVMTIVSEGTTKLNQHGGRKTHRYKSVAALVLLETTLRKAFHLTSPHSSLQSPRYPITLALSLHSNRKFLVSLLLPNSWQQSGNNFGRGSLASHNKLTYVDTHFVIHS